MPFMPFICHLYWAICPAATCRYHVAQSAVVELEHFIGYGGKHLNTLRYHPTEVRRHQCRCVVSCWWSDQRSPNSAADPKHGGFGKKLNC